MVAMLQASSGLSRGWLCCVQVTSRLCVPDGAGKQWRSLRRRDDSSGIAIASPWRVLVRSKKVFSYLRGSRHTGNRLIVSSLVGSIGVLHRQ